MKCAIIGGSGCQEFLPDEVRERTVETKYGKVSVYEKGEMVYLLRHAKGHTVPPHLINYRAHIEALRLLGVEKIVALYAVGSISDQLPPGQAGLLGDIIDMTSGRVSTFYNEQGKPFQHVPMDNPFSSSLNEKLISSAHKKDMVLADNLTYVCTNGPRLETPAEIRMHASFGCDVVGMTAAGEVALAHEADIEIAGIAFSINWAAGVHSDRISFIDDESVHELTGALTSLAEGVLTQM